MPRFFAYFFSSFVFSSFVFGSDCWEMYEEAKEITRHKNQALPVIYSNDAYGGYFRMPSAKMGKEGSGAIAFASIDPYSIYSLNLQPFHRLELHANYWDFEGNTNASNGVKFSPDRVAGAKWGLLMSHDIKEWMPQISLGAIDSLGIHRFCAYYAVMTKEIIAWGLEGSLGWGLGQIQGGFGGLAWSPFCKGDSVLKGLSLIGEYDASQYEKIIPKKVGETHSRHPVNYGIAYRWGPHFQLSVSRQRGEVLSAGANLQWPIGSAAGLFPKTGDPAIKRSPSIESRDQTVATDLCTEFNATGLAVLRIEMGADSYGRDAIWIDLANARYRDERDVFERIVETLARFKLDKEVRYYVSISSDGLVSHTYIYTSEELKAYKEGKRNLYTMSILSPLGNTCCQGNEWDRSVLFSRKQLVWKGVIRPRIITYFGSTLGDFKYTVGAIGTGEAQAGEHFIAGIQVSYPIHTSHVEKEVVNPSKLFIVRTDSLRFYRGNDGNLEKLYVQGSKSFDGGIYGRLSAGYFEIAYGGLAGEILWAPASHQLGFGLSAAVLKKRRYEGLAFTNKVPIFEDGKEVLRHFTPFQCSLDLYYSPKCLPLDWKVMVGQFLAKDRGVRVEATRCFPNGIRVGLWYTWTNVVDLVNGRNYHDKGFAFTIPFDFFLKKSSRATIGEAMSVWLRDVGAIAETGKSLYPIIREERRVHR